MNFAGNTKHSAHPDQGKFELRHLMALASVGVVAVMAARFGVIAAWLTLFVLGALHAPQGAKCFVPTLTVTEILTDVMDAFKLVLPAFKMFSTDMSAEGVMKGQTVIAHLPLVPAVTDHDVDAGYTASAQNARDLLVDVPITINQWKDVAIKIKHGDAVVDRSKNYLKTVNNAGYALAKAVVDYCLGKFLSQNVSQSTTKAVADADSDTLGTVRKAMNVKKAGVPRFAIVNSDFFDKLDSDTRITSRDFYGQQTGGEAFGVLRNVKGFREVLEYPDLPDNNVVLGTFTANASTEVITVSVAHGLVVGDRVQFTTTNTLPAGLSLVTTYYVITVPSATTITVSATSGGSVVNITDTGTGTHSIARYENLLAACFDNRAIGVATRLPLDSTDLAKQLGIPVNFKVEVVQDTETDFAIMGLWWLDGNLQINLVATIMFDAVVGRQGGAAGDKLDYAGHRVQGA